MAETAGVTFQRGGRSSSGNFFQPGAYFIGVLHLLEVRSLNDCGGISRKCGHSESLKFDKGFQDRFVVQLILCRNFAELYGLARSIAASKEFSGQSRPPQPS